MMLGIRNGLFTVQYVCVVYCGERRPQWGDCSYMKMAYFL